MFVSARTIQGIGSAWSFPALAAVLVAALQPALAQGTHLWTQSRLGEFEKGTPQGVALTSDGHLREGPALSKAFTTPSTFLWSVAVDRNGTAYLDTTPPVVTGLTAVDGEADCSHVPFTKKVRETFDAGDAFSPIAHDEYSLDAGPWQFIKPMGGLSDSTKQEHYGIHLQAAALAGNAGEHSITVRVYDRNDNVGVAKTALAAQAK